MTAGDQVAVVIPCHNYGHLVAEAIESALAQTLTLSEIVVVDDGSTDATADVTRTYAPRVRLVQQRCRGLSAARNTGAALVSSDYVMFLDADDTLEPTYVEHCLRAIRETPTAAFAYTQVRMFGATSGTSSFPPWDVERLLRENFVHASALLPTALVREVRYNERLKRGREDWDFYLGLAGRGLSGVLVDEPLLNYRQHPTSMLATLRRRPWVLHLGYCYLLVRHWRLYGWRRVVSGCREHLRQLRLEAVANIRKR
ncbi:MAG: glycosyltransferase family 2 protein [Frankiales bacterium]|nr:glycosyltransferase family 2 protein [Frankiales bacterium]